MPGVPGSPFADHFAALTDPRRDRTKRHLSLDILAIALRAILGGADEWAAIGAYGAATQGWLETSLPLPDGLPPHDTSGRVSAALDPDRFEARFLAWAQSAVALAGGAVIARDGKAVRRPHDHGAGEAAVRLVGARASAQRLVLGQRAADEKSNEIAAIPASLDALPLEGCIVAIDAMGCQTKIAAAIVEKEADYALALKESHDTRYRAAAQRLPTPPPRIPETMGRTWRRRWTAGMAGRRFAGTGRPAIRQRSPRLIPLGNGRGCAALAWSERGDANKGNAVASGAAA